MFDARRMPLTIRLPGGLKWALISWLVAEIVVFALVVHLLGLAGAILLGLGISVLGVAMLRRIGTEAARSLRGAVTGGEAPNGALLDGMLSALGAVLLILPGFVANIGGAALAAPSVRGWLSTRFDGGLSPVRGTGRGRPPVDVIDLTPEDWRIVDR